MTIVALTVLSVLLACAAYVLGYRRGRARVQDLVRQLEAKDGVISGYRRLLDAEKDGFQLSPSGKIFRGPSGDLLQASSIAALAKTFVNLREVQKEKTSIDSGIEVDVDRFRKL